MAYQMSASSDILAILSAQGNHHHNKQKKLLCMRLFIYLLLPP